MFTEVINQAGIGSFSPKLLYLQTSSCNLWSRSLLAIRKNASLRHFCIGFTFQPPKLRPLLLYSLCSKHSDTTTMSTDPQVGQIV